MTDEGTHPAARLAQGGQQGLGIAEGRGALGQLSEPAESDDPEDRTQAGAEGFRPLPFDQQHDAGARAHERNDDARPSDQGGQPGVHGVPDRAERLAPERQGQEDPQCDQADRPQIGRVAAEK